MNTTDSLLELLADGCFHSGEELGQLLGVSRTAIWKQVSKLDELGIVVESVKGKGYRISGGVNLLAEEIILAQLSPLSSLRLNNLIIERSVESTNTFARDNVKGVSEVGLAVLAEQQTAGRGRRGRQWQSPFGRNIYMSLVWGFDTGVEALEGLSLAVGVAVCRAAERCKAYELKLKWPNDLLFKGKKVGGILLEVVGDPSGFCQVVIGVGLNIDMEPEQAKAIDQPWANLDEAAVESIDRNVLAGCVLDELLQLLNCYEEAGFASFRDEWLLRDGFSNMQVNLMIANREIKGVARGVSGSGALLLEENLAGGSVIREYSGGEISMRGR